MESTAARRNVAAAVAGDAQALAEHVLDWMDGNPESRSSTLEYLHQVLQGALSPFLVRSLAWHEARWAAQHRGLVDTVRKELVDQYVITQEAAALCASARCTLIGGKGIEFYERHQPSFSRAESSFFVEAEKLSAAAIIADFCGDFGDYRHRQGVG
jgi:hypothetical protein